MAKSKKWGCITLFFYLTIFFSSNTCLIILGGLSVIKISIRSVLPSLRSENREKRGGGGTLKIEQKQKKIILSTYKATTPVSQRPGKNFKNKKDSGKNLKKTNQTRIVYRRNWKRIFSDNQEKQKSEKNAGKIVDYRNAYLYLWILSSFDCTLSFFTHLLEYYRVCLLVNLAVKKIQFRWKLLKNNIL